MPQEVDIGRRQLVFGTIAGVTMLAAEGALSQVEQAYSALDTATSFPDRKNRTSLTHSASHDRPAQMVDISQGQPGKMQPSPTPTENPTVTAAKNDLIVQQDQKAKTDNTFAWVSYIGTPAGLVITGALGVAGYWYNRGKDREARRIEEEHRRQDQDIDRRKRDEDRFREAVLDLGKDETKLGGATTLRTFLQEEGRGYERFYQQIFDLSVGFLRLRKVDQNNPDPDPFYKEIIRAFCESAPLVREMRNLQTLSQSDVPNFENYQRKFFNASHIHLENADLVLVDLRLADLISANFSGANLISAKFSGANLTRADLSEADLTRANPEEASFLVGTRMWDVKNYPDLVKRQKCRGKGADFNTPPPAPDTKGEKK